MLYTGLFKRIIPFVLTFAAGLLLAGLFGSAIIPNFERGRDGRRGHWGHQGKQQLLMEIDQLKQELRDLKLENEALREGASDSDKNFDADVWVVRPTLEEHHPPAPPAPPKRPKHPKFDQ